MKEIYLDNSATTRICPEALAKYNDISLSQFGNPSSLHREGFLAEKELDTARERIKASVYSKDAEVVFTGSGTEANNLAILGRAFSKERYRHGSKIITTKGEHASVNEPLKLLKELGYTVAEIPTLNGEVDLSVLEKELSPSTVLVTMMLVNNETGAVYNIPEVAKLIKAKSPDAYLHVDATQGYMKIPFSLSVLGADLLTVSSHKIEGPKGVGALIISPRVKKEKGLRPIMLGGGQEQGIRSGTENVPGICAFGEAVAVGMSRRDESIKHMEELRSYLIDNIEKRLPEISITKPRLHAPHILNLTLPDIKSETMLHFLSSLGISVSSGSACSSNSSHKSSALIAYGRSKREADCSIRISFSRTNTKNDVDALTEALSEGLSKLSRIKI